ncbi:MAG: NUDIX hydrolase, partial [Gemmatimonadetes bacterium]|nr:NUDIX hydrolase [Gemmatimonadota bacterium]
GVYSARDRDPRAHSITVVFAANVTGTARIGDPMEVSEIHAFAPHELPFGHMALGSDAMLRDYFDGRTALS